MLLTKLEDPYFTLFVIGEMRIPGNGVIRLLIAGELPKISLMDGFLLNTTFKKVQSMQHMLNQVHGMIQIC